MKNDKDLTAHTINNDNGKGGEVPAGGESAEICDVKSGNGQALLSRPHATTRSQNDRNVQNTMLITEDERIGPGKIISSRDGVDIANRTVDVGQTSASRGAPTISSQSDRDKVRTEQIAVVAVVPFPAAAVTTATNAREAANVDCGRRELSVCSNFVAAAPAQSTSTIAVAELLAPVKANPAPRPEMGSMLPNLGSSPSVFEEAAAGTPTPTNASAPNSGEKDALACSVLEGRAHQPKVDETYRVSEFLCCGGDNKDNGKPPPIPAIAHAAVQQGMASGGACPSVGGGACPSVGAANAVIKTTEISVQNAGTKKQNILFNPENAVKISSAQPNRTSKDSGDLSGTQDFTKVTEQLRTLFSDVCKRTALFFSRKVVLVWTAIFVSSVILFMLVHSTRQSMCVTSTQTKNLDWMRFLFDEFRVQNNPKFSMLDLNPILTETSDFSLSDKLNLWMGCPLYLIESASRFKQRNPLEKYDQVRFYLDYSMFSSTLLLVNASCEDLIEIIGDMKTGSQAECLHQRQKLFNLFLRKHVNHLVGKSRVIDIPAANDTQIYSNQIFIAGRKPDFRKKAFDNLNGLEAGQADEFDDSMYNVEQHWQISQEAAKGLVRTAAKTPYETCENAEPFLDRRFSRFQFAAVGLEGAGKSTTLFWLAHHLELSEEVKNSCASAKIGASFTRHLNPIKLAPHLKKRSMVLSDTMGLPGFEEQYVCEMKYLMDGKFSKYQPMYWNGNCPFTSISSMISGMFTKQKEYNPSDEVHVLLFVINFIDESNEEERKELRKIIKKMKMGVKGLFDSDLTQRMVFAVSRAVTADVQEFARDIGISELDIFPLNTAATLMEKTNVIVPPEVLLPIMTRLTQKACKYYAEELESMHYDDFSITMNFEWWQLSSFFPSIQYLLVHLFWKNLICFNCACYCLEVFDLQFLKTTFSFLFSRKSAFSRDILSAIAFSVSIYFLTYLHPAISSISEIMTGVLMLSFYVFIFFTAIFQQKQLPFLVFMRSVLKLLILALYFSPLAFEFTQKHGPLFIGLLAVFLIALKITGHAVKYMEICCWRFNEIQCSFSSFAVDYDILLVQEFLVLIKLLKLVRPAGYLTVKLRLIERAQDILNGMVPPGWSPDTNLSLVSVCSDQKCRKTLKKLLLSSDVGAGGRDQSYSIPRYSRLEIAKVWRIENCGLWRKYIHARQRVHTLLQGGLPPVNIRKVLHSEGEDLAGPPLDHSINEVRLLHGTDPQNLLNILYNGLNERMSGSGAGSAFGEGIYLADDAAKADHYAKVDDSSYQEHDARHKLLFPKSENFSSGLYYILVCRAVLGFPIHSLDGVYATAPVAGAPIFATTNRRELRAIEGINPPLHHQSLVLHFPYNVLCHVCFDMASPFNIPFVKALFEFKLPSIVLRQKYYRSCALVCLL